MSYQKFVSLRLGKELYEQLEKEAKQKRENISEAIRDILTAHFAQRKTEAVVDSFLGMVLEDKEIKQLIKKKLKER